MPKPIDPTAEPVNCRVCGQPARVYWRRSSTYSNRPDHLVVRCRDWQCWGFAFEVRAEEYATKDLQPLIETAQKDRQAWLIRAAGIKAKK